jgi:hypothetical protein
MSELRPNWTFVLTNPAPSSTRIQELKAAHGRRITFRLDGISDAQFSLPGLHEEASLLQPLASDIMCYREDIVGTRRLLYRGRIITETDDMTDNGHFAQFSCNDYRGMLGNRVVPPGGLAYTNSPPVDVGFIAFDLITATQSQTGGNWGITSGLGGTSGVTHVISYDAGSNILEMITNLGHRQTGAFEWEIDANLAMNRWFPTRGSATGAVLDYGGVVVTAHRLLQASDFANVVVVTGDGSTTTPVQLTSSTVATDPMGRWERTSSYDIKEQATLSERALWALALLDQIRPSWTVELASGAWDIDTMWLGDTVSLQVQSGRLNVAVPHPS